jgi:hypothetical protein
LARTRRLVVERVLEIDGSVLAFGRRGSLSVVLKLAKRQGDEWKAGDVLADCGRPISEPRSRR